MKPKENAPKPLLVKILQWLYLLFAIAALSSIFAYQQIPQITQLGFPNELIIGVLIAITIYCLVLSLSFFLQNTTLLIISLVLIFFTSISSIVLLGIAIPNAGPVISGDLPACAKNLATCTLKEGIIISSAGLMSVSIPTLLLNVITIIGAVKGIAASD